MIGTVIETKFTRGSPFGEQYWVFDVEGQRREFAMSLNFNVPDRWPREGDTVEIKEMPPKRCYTGGGGYIESGPWADLVTIIKRKDAA
jgi:hypothetical protein